MASRRLAGLLSVALAAAASADFGYEDNVAASLEAGREALLAGRHEDAEVELENVLLMAPGSREAHELLVKVYAKTGREDLGRKLIQRMRRGRLVTPGKIAALQDLLRGHETPVRAARGGLWDGVVPALPPPGAATPSGERKAASVAELEDAPLESGLDDLLTDLEDPPDTPAPPPPSAPATGAPDASDPWALHAYSVAEYQRTGSALEPGKLFVKALEAAPELLAESDGGLFDATYEAYTARVKADPDNHEARFILAFLREKRGEDGEALKDYKRIAAGAPPGGRLARASAAKAQAMQAEIDAIAAEEAAKKKAAEKLDAERSMAAITKGESDEAETPQDYRDKGRAAHKTFEESRDKRDLELAAAWFKGAIAKEPGEGENHYRYALVKIDLATMGEDGAKAEAKDSLEKALALRPAKDIQADAENLLKALTRR